MGQANQGVDGVLRPGRTGGRRQVGVAHPIDAVDVLRRLCGPDQRAVTAGVHRHIARAGEFQGVQGVPGRLVDRHVTRDGGDGNDPAEAGRGGEDQRDRVVGAGVGVDDQGYGRVLRIPGVSAQAVLRSSVF